MKYRAINAQSTGELEELVNEAIKEGWIPLGPLAAAPWSYRKEDGVGTQVSGCTYTQAMVQS